MAEKESKTNISHADFVSKIVKDPKSPPDTILLTGYLGKSSEDGHTRLYFDPELKSYVEIPNDAILHSQSTSQEQGGLEASHVWISREAELIHGKVGPSRTKAKFFEGPIAAAAGAGVPGLQPHNITHAPCLTHLACQTHVVKCATHVAACTVRGHVCQIPSVPQVCFASELPNCIHSAQPPCPIQSAFGPVCGGGGIPVVGDPAAHVAAAAIAGAVQPQGITQANCPSHQPLCVFLKPSIIQCQTPFHGCPSPLVGCITGAHCTAAFQCPTPLHGCPPQPPTPLCTHLVHCQTPPATPRCTNPPPTPECPSLLGVCPTPIAVCRDTAAQCQFASGGCPTPGCPTHVPACGLRTPIAVCLDTAAQCQFASGWCPIPTAAACPTILACPQSPFCPVTPGCPFGPGGGGPQF